MVDIHSHLLPGVDDGSPSVADSLPVLERFAQEGVEVLVCTPHLNASSAARAPHEEHERILAELRQAAATSPVLHSGWEIMLDVPGADLTDPRLGLGGSTAVLVEFPRMSVPPNATEELFRLRMSGVVPVVAHPERYWGCTAEQVSDWRRVGAVMQLDAAGVLGGGAMGKLSIELLERGLIDLISSDNHGDRRSLRQARDWLTEAGAEEHAELLTRVNAQRLLANEATVPVPALRRARSLVGRFREMILGRRTS